MTNRTLQRFGRSISLASVLAAAAIVAPLAQRAWAQQEFRSLIGQLPSSTNAVVILNVDNMKKSPLGIREGFAENLEKAFRAGLVRVPPRATRFIAASQLDLEFMTPVYEVAVFDLDTKPSMEAIAKEYGGNLDTLDGLPGVQLQTDSFAVQLGPQTVGIMRPANRQEVLRWISQTRPGTGLQMSPYLQKAAGYSDDAGTDIIIAIDLGGAFSWGAVGGYLKSKQALLDEEGIDLKDATDALQKVQGVRVGIRITEQPVGKLAIDFSGPVNLPEAFAKKLVVEILADVGAQFDDLGPWTCGVSGSEISLSGTLSRDGLRRLGSLVDSPAPSRASEDGSEVVSPGDQKAAMVAASQEYFKTITDMFDDLKRDWRELKNLASGAVYFDRYARRIEQMPILNVDEGLLDYGQYVSGQLRNAAGAVRTMGIRGGVRKAQISGYDVGPTATYSVAGSRYGYGGYRFGWGTTSYTDPYDAVKRVGAERRKISAQERGTMATSVFQIRDDIVAATNEVRRGLTQKYQTEF